MAARQPGAIRWAGPLLVVVAGLGMLGWSWGTWPDVLIDFGRELYVPWRLARGEVLFRDLAHFNGPLSPYVNALMFHLFGVSLRTLVAANLAVLAVVVVLLYRLLLAVGGALAATVACLVFLVLFAFGQFTFVGNGNFVCPYSHEITHGALLSLAALHCLRSYQKRRRALWAALAGVALGLAFLTKVEVFLAAFLATSGGFALALWAERPGRRRRTARVAGLLLGSTLLPPLIAFVLLWMAMPAGQALGGTLGSWRYVFNRTLAANAYYRRVTGLDAPRGNLLRMLRWTLRYVIVLGPGLVLAVVVRRRSRAVGWLAAGAFVATVMVLYQLRWRVHWEDALRPLPVAMLLLTAGAALGFLRQRRTGGDADRPTMQLATLAFALLMLLKMGLHARIYHYGFVLAMPAVMMLVVALVGWVPSWLGRRGRAGAVFLANSLAVLVVFVGVHLYITAKLYWEPKVHWVGRGGDAFLADWRGRAVIEALELIERHIGPGQTLAIFPEGVMLNYLARRQNPTPFIKFVPPELIMFGEEAMVAAFLAHPPDFILLVHKDTTEYGFRFFGRDYARRLGAWIEGNYRAVGPPIGAMPLRDGRFGILLLRRIRLP